MREGEGRLKSLISMLIRPILLFNVVLWFCSLCIISLLACEAGKAQKNIAKEKAMYKSPKSFSREILIQYCCILHCHYIGTLQFMQR